MSGRLVIADDVRTALGDTIARADKPGENFRCPKCGVHGSTSHGDDASVVLIRLADGNSVINYFHASCMDSRILDAEGSMSDLADVTGTERDVSTLSLVQTQPNGNSRAILIVSLLRGVTAVLPTGDAIDPWFGDLLDAGWTLATSESSQPLRARSWKLDFDRSTSQGRIISTKSGGVFLDRMPDLHPEWISLAARQQEVTVFATRDADFTGTLNRMATEGDAYLSQFLQEAAQEGNLIAARISMVSRGTKPGKGRVTRRDDARRTLASALETALHERARPGQPASTGANARPDLISFPTRPRLTEVAVGTYQLLVVDLAATSAQQTQVTQVLTALTSLGFEVMRTFEDGPLAVAPKGWHYVLWESQILILTPDDTKFLFEPLRPTGDWYRRVGDQHELGILVGSLTTPYSDNDPNSFADALLGAMATGQVVGCSLRGILATQPAVF